MSMANSDRKYGVTLLTSYATANKSDSFWVYEAPSFSAVEKCGEGERCAVRVDRGDP
jgi:hypothetical protein